MDGLIIMEGEAKTGPPLGVDVPLMVALPEWGKGSVPKSLVLRQACPFKQAFG